MTCGWVWVTLASRRQALHSSAHSSNTDHERPLHAVLEVERVRGADQDPARRRVVAAALLLLLAGRAGGGLHRRPPLEAEILDGIEDYHVRAGEDDGFLDVGGDGGALGGGGGGRRGHGSCCWGWCCRVACCWAVEGGEVRDERGSNEIVFTEEVQNASLLHRACTMGMGRCSATRLHVTFVWASQSRIPLDSHAPHPRTHTHKTGGAAS